MNTRISSAMALVFIPSALWAGAFSFTEDPVFEAQADPDNVVHPIGYNVSTGTPSAFSVNVCIVPGSPNASSIATSVQNIVDRFNLLVPVVENIRQSPSFSSLYDFESVTLHEVGHCLGLNHPNAASEAPSGTGDERESTKANFGGNSTLNYGAGGDGIYGSHDDIRGDDVNLHYFEPDVNNPFKVLRSVDSTNYTRAVAGLPAGDLFPANAEKEVAATARYGASPNDCGFFTANQRCAEAVMQQGTPNAELQNALGPDDVATLLYARSGVDRLAGTGDDYAATLVYQGISNSNCDINISFNDAETGFAVCKTSTSSGPATFNGSADAVALTQANVFLDPDAVSWDFSSVRIPLPGSDVVTVTAGASTGTAPSVLTNDTNQAGSGTLAATPRSFGGPEHGTVSINTNGTFNYTNTNASATSDFFVYEVCVSATTACAHQIVQITIDDGELLFMNGFEAP